MVAEHYMNTILTWFSTSRQRYESILTWFSTSRQLYEKYFDMIFHLKATIWKVFWHDFPPQGNYMKSIFDMIFHLKAAQNFIAEHEERDFELIFQFKTAQNVVRRHYERDFDMIFHFNKSPKMSCKTALWRKYYFDMNFLFMRLKSGLQSTKKEILKWFSTWMQLKTSLQSAME